MQIENDYKKMKEFLAGTVISPRYKMLRHRYPDDFNQVAYIASLSDFDNLRDIERYFWRLLEQLYKELVGKRTATDPELTQHNVCVECNERVGVYKKINGGRLCRRCGMRERMREVRERSRNA